MNKKTGLLALTGALTLAACGPTTPPTVCSADQVLENNQCVTKPVTTTVGSVTVQNPNGYTVVIKDAAGNVIPASQYGNLKPGTYTIIYSKDGYVTQTLSFTVVAGQPVTVTAPVLVAVGTPTSDAKISITTPSNGAVVTAEQVSLAFTTSKPLTDITCSVAGGTPVAAVYGAGSGTCEVNVKGLNGQTAVITVSGKDSTGAVAASSVNVQVALPGTFNPVTVSGITFDGAQQLVKSDRGLIGEVKDANGKYQVVKNGWSYVAQGTSTPADPASYGFTYVKGAINVSYTAPNATDEIEVFLHRTTGSDVPKLDQIDGSTKLKTGTGKVDYVLDSTKLSEFEGTRQWLVVRVNKSTLYYRAVVADNQAPKPADPVVSQGTPNAKLTPARSAFLEKQYYDVKTKTPFNWVSGNLQIAASNIAQVQDEPNGAAPSGATPAQRMPSGLESVTYYLVPEEEAIKIVTSDADMARRADMVRNYAAAWSNPVKASQDGLDTDYRVEFDSVGAAGITQEEVTYRVYAITRDLMGNEAASPTFKAVRFDNIGPKVTGSALCDASPLPYVSTNPCKYISDLAAFNPGVIENNSKGAPVDYASYNVNLGGIDLIRRGVVVNDGLFDTNRLADGEYSFNYLGLTDVLGNPAELPKEAKIVIDNTDPEPKLAALNGVYNSGETISVGSTGSDTLSGTYQNLLLWDDQLLTTTEKIGKPVEIGRTTAPLEGNAKNLEASKGLIAPYNITARGTRQTYRVTNLVIDRAGNAAMARKDVVVQPKTTVRGNPVLGKSDAFTYPASADYRETTPFSLEYGYATADDSTKLRFAPISGSTAGSSRMELAANGTYTINGDNAQTGVSSNNYSEKLDTVKFYGQYAYGDWEKISAYLAGDESVFKREAQALIEMIERQQTKAMQNAVYQLFLVGLDRRGNFSDAEIEYLVGLGYSETMIRDFQNRYTSEGVILPFVPNAEEQFPILSTPGEVLNYDGTNDEVRAQLAALLGDTEANKLIRDMISRLDAGDLNGTALENLRDLYVDPTLGYKSGLQNDRLHVQGWGLSVRDQNGVLTNEVVGDRDYVAQPWLALAPSSTAGTYAVDTDLINNLYFMQDNIAVSVPSNAVYGNIFAKASKFAPYYRTVGVSGVNDAITFIAQDTAGTYSAAGEAVASAVEFPLPR